MKSLLIQEEVAWLDALPGSLSCMWWVEGLLIYFMLGSKLMHFIWNIALSFLGIGVRPLCSVTSHCHLQTAEWLHAQVSAASAWDHNCSIPCLGLVHWLAFQPSHWSINHAPNYMCTDICCMPGFSLASQWLLWIASDWSDCCMECSHWLGCSLCILLSASHLGSGSADWSGEIARYLMIKDSKIIQIFISYYLEIWLTLNCSKHVILTWYNDTTCTETCSGFCSVLMRRGWVNNKP